LNAPSKPDRLTTLTAGFLAQPHRLLIGGDWVPAQSGETFEVLNPASGRVLAHVASGAAVDMDAAVKAARKAFQVDGWGNSPPALRRSLLLALADAIETEAEEFCLLESLDNGMPLAMAHWAAYLGPVEILRYNAGWAGKINGETLSVSAANQHAYTLREPIGVVGAIIPWNGPILVALSKLAPALAAGCTVVLKPAELTPLTAIRLGQLIVQVGFPPGVVNIVTGFGDTAGKALVDHPDVDKISFTGSTLVGKSIVRAAAGNLKRVSLELGGKSPVLIFPDADLDKAIEGAAAGIFSNSGQVCVAGSRLYVHKAVFDKVLHGVAERAAGLRVGSGQDPDTQMGPLISQKQLDRVSGYVESGREEGAEIVTGGRRIGNEGYYMQPTVLAQTNHSMRVVREEIFGPVVCAMPIEDQDLERIVATANDTDYGLSAYIWTQNISIAHKLARKIRSGTVRINGGTSFDLAVPFGGFRQSGWGREYGKEGVEMFLETKSVTIAL
jgi:phenylacetaldehyde dehydrogenase